MERFGLTQSQYEHCRPLASFQADSLALKQRFTRGTRQSRSQYLCRVTAETQTVSRGASGLDIQGLRPTSPAAWRIVSDFLRSQKVRTIAQHELIRIRDRGVKVVDIRPPKDYEQAHIEGSINIPLYRPITGWDPRRVARRAGFALFGVLNGTEVNPGFFGDILQIVDHEAGAVLVCNMGGTLEPTATNGSGQQSRSLMAAYEAVMLGAKNISVLRGGFMSWRRRGRPYIDGSGNQIRDEAQDDEEEE